MAKRRTDRHPSPQQPETPATPKPAQDELGGLGQMPNFSLDEPAAPPGAAFELSAFEDPNEPQFPVPTAVPVDPRSIDPSKPPMVAKLATPVEPPTPPSGVFEAELAEPIEAQPASHVIEAELARPMTALPASDAVEAEVFEAEPASAIFEAAPASDVIEAQPASAVIEAAAASDVVEAEPASAIVAEPASAVIEAAPASDVVEAEPVSAVVAEPASAVIEAGPASDAVEAEPASAVVAESASAVIEAAPASDVVEAEPASAVIAEPASAVIEAAPASDVVEVEPASAVVAEPASAVFEAAPESDVVETEPGSAVVAEAASAVIVAAPASEVVEAAPASAVLDAEVFADEEPEERAAAGGLPSSSVFAAELVAESAPSSKSKKAASDVFAAEFADKPSSVSKKKPVQAESKAKKPASPPPSSDVFAAEFLEDVTPVSSASKAGGKAQEPKSDVLEASSPRKPRSAAKPVEPASAVVEAEPASGLIAQPASNILEAEPEMTDEPIAAAEPASAVVEAESASAIVEAAEPASASVEAEPGYAVIEPEELPEQEALVAEPASAVVVAADEIDEIEEPLVAQPASAIVEAEPASAVVEAAAEMDEVEEPLVAEAASAVVEAEPASAVVEAADEIDEPLVAEPASAVVEAVEESDEVVEPLVAEPASAVVEAEPASAVTAEPASAVVEAGPASAVVAEAESAIVAAEPASAVAEAEPASAIAEAEPASAVFAEEAEPASAIAEAEEAALADEGLIAGESALNKVEAPSAPKSPAGKKRKDKGKQPPPESEVEWDEALPEELASSEIAWESEEEEEIPRPIPILDDDLSDETVAFEPLPEKNKLLMSTEEDEALSWDAPPSSASRKQEAPSSKSRKKEIPSSISRKQEAPSSKSKKKEAPSSKSKKQEAPSSKSKKQEAPSSAARKKVEEKSGVKKPGKRGVMAEADEEIFPAAEPIEEASILEDEEIAVAAEPSSVALVAEEVVEDEPEEIAEAVEVDEAEVVEAEAEDEIAEAEEVEEAEQDFTEVGDEETVAEALEDDEIADAEEIEEEEIAEAEEEGEIAEAEEIEEEEIAEAEEEEEIAEAEEEEAQPARRRGQRVAAAESDEETIGEDEITEAEDEETIAEAEDEEIAEAEDEEIAEAEDEEIAEAEEEEDVVTEFEEGEEYATTEDEDDAVTQFEEEEEIAEAEDEDEEFAAKPSAKKKRGKQALADEEEEPIPSKKKKGKAKLLTAIEPEEEELDEELTEAEAEEEPMPAGKRGKKPAASYMEVDEEEGAVAVLKRRPKPKYGRRWIGGMILGWLLLGGAGYGVWHFAPHLIKQAYAQIPLEKDPDDPIQLARDHMNEFKYAKALVDLRDQEKTPLVLAMRGEARWLNYLQENKGKATLNPKDADVEQAIKELTEAKNEALVMQIQKTLEAAGPKDEPAQLQDLAKEMRNMLVKSKEIAAGDDTKTFAATLQEVLKKRLEFEEKYNGVAKVLADGKFIADKSKIDLDEFDKLMKDLASNRTALENVNKLLEKAEFKDPGEKGVEKLIAAWTDLVNKVADVNKLLADAKTKGDGAKGVKELIDARANLETERDGLETLIKQAVKELVDANAVPAGGDTHKDLMQGLKIIRVKAESPLGVPLSYFASSMMSVGTGVARFLDSKLENVALQAELKFYQVREPLIDTPEQKLEMFVSLLQDRRQKDPDVLRLAERDATWLLSKDAGANLEIRAKASYLRALAYRNQFKFAEAKKALEAALDDGKAARLVNAKKADVWLNPIKETQRELTDPTAYYLPRVARMQAAGYWQMAVDELTVALSAMPDDGRLLARRAYARFELVRSEPKYITGKFTKEEREAIRGDADLAAKAPEAAGEANYVLGLVEEELGNFTLAEQNYRKAIKAVEAVKGPADEIGKIRIALARLLQRPTSTGGPESRLLPPDRSIVTTTVPVVADERDACRYDNATIVVHPLSMLLAATVVAAQPGAIDDDDDPAAKVRLKESEDIAKELMMSDNPKIKGQGHLLLGQVLAKKGRRTEGLRVYIEGLKLIHPGRETSELIKMMEEHPIFQLPDVTTRPNPFLADYHYSEGLRRYWERDYVNAEKHLKMAATYNDRYAPYFYFLGLSQLAQKTRLKRDAADLAFTKAGKLEAKNLPNYSEVNQNLERIQGELRRYLNRYRMGGVNEFDRLDK